jgi:hypothetical protein
MKTFYVSLVRDLLGVYLEFQAESEAAVHEYLKSEYHRNGEWRLLWCAVYEADQLPAYIVSRGSAPIIVKALCGQLWEENRG